MSKNNILEDDFKMYIDFFYRTDLNYELRRSIAEQFDLHYNEIKGGDTFDYTYFPIDIHYCAAADSIGLCRYIKRFEN